MNVYTFGTLSVRCHGSMGFARRLERRQARVNPPPVAPPCPVAPRVKWSLARPPAIESALMDALMAAMLTRCPNCGTEGRVERSCAETELPPERHAEVAEVFGAQHLHLYCPACGVEGVVEA